MKAVTRIVLFLVAMVALDQCGGKKGIDTGNYPVAIIRADQSTVEPGQQVTLRGGDSRDPGGRPLTFHWSQMTTNPMLVVFSANDSRDAFVVTVTMRLSGMYGFVLVVENDQGVMSIPDSVFVNVTPADWKATENPCSSNFLDEPQAVDSLIAEIKAEGVSDSDRDRYADELDRDAQLNEENGLEARAAKLRCKAWLLRHQ